MAAYYINSGRAFGARFGQGHARQVISRVIPIACTTTMLTTGNTVAVAQIPKGAVLVSARLGATDMDSNGAPTLAISLGDAGSGTRIFSSSTVGQAGTLDAAFARAALGYKWTSDTALLVTFTTGSATAVAGTLTVVIEYFVDVDFDTTGATASTTA